MSPPPMPIGFREWLTKLPPSGKAAMRKHFAIHLDHAAQVLASFASPDEGHDDTIAAAIGAKDAFERLVDMVELTTAPGEPTEAEALLAEWIRLWEEGLHADRARELVERSCAALEGRGA